MNRTHLKFTLAILGATAVLTACCHMKSTLPAAANYDQQVAALLAQMTLDEKIGQMVQADLSCVHDRADIQKYGFGTMLSGGDSKPAGENNPESWLKTCNELQSWALKTRLKIPLLY